MTRIYLIRHAEAEGNLYRRAHGRYDANITPLGRRQTAALAERFRDVPIDALWTSDLIRAQSTASALLKYHPGLTMHQDPALREVDLGCWEDRTWGEIISRYSEEYWIFARDPAQWHVPGSEDYEALWRRVRGALLGLGSAYAGKTVAVVSHAFVIRAVAAHLMEKRYADIPYGDNTAVTTLEAEGESLRIVSYADGSHLGHLSTFVRQGLAEDHLGSKAEGLPTAVALPEERELYVRCYRETWLASHGNLKGFVPEIYLASAEERAKEDPQCLVKLLYDGAPAGIIELDPVRGKAEGAGWISLLWVESDMRGRRFGAQLMGHAVSYFRRLGRTALRLHVSQTNTDAIGFYEAIGFRVLGTARGVGGPQYLMELDISQKVWLLP